MKHLTILLLGMMLVTSFAFAEETVTAEGATSLKNEATSMAIDTAEAKGKALAGEAVADATDGMGGPVGSEAAQLGKSTVSKGIGNVADDARASYSGSEADAKAAEEDLEAAEQVNE